MYQNLVRVKLCVGSPLFLFIRNCYIPHLFKYLLAKVLGACARVALAPVGLLNLHTAACSVYRLILCVYSDDCLQRSRPPPMCSQLSSYARVAWALILRGLGMPVDSTEFTAGIYFMTKSLSHCCLDSSSSADNVNIDLLSKEYERIMPMFDGNVHELGSMYASLAGGSEWDDAKAGEILRDHFRREIL